MKTKTLRMKHGILLSGSLGAAMLLGACANDGYYSDGYTSLSVTTYGAYPRDRDGDGVPNRYDRDRDGDGVPNRFDDRLNIPYRD